MRCKAMRCGAMKCDELRGGGGSQRREVTPSGPGATKTFASLTWTRPAPRVFHRLAVSSSCGPPAAAAAAAAVAAILAAESECRRGYHALWCPPSPVRDSLGDPGARRCLPSIELLRGFVTPPLLALPIAACFALPSAACFARPSAACFARPSTTSETILQDSKTRVQASVSVCARVYFDCTRSSVRMAAGVNTGMRRDCHGCAHPEWWRVHQARRGAKRRIHARCEL